MYELLIKSQEVKRSSSQGLQGKIVQLPTEVPLRKNPCAQQPSPSIGRCGFGEEDGSRELIIFEILATERLRLMGFDNRLIIDYSANAVNILMW